MVPYLRAANVKDGRLDLEDVKSMDFSPAEQVILGLQAGDVLVRGSRQSRGSRCLCSVECRDQRPGVLPEHANSAEATTRQ